MLSVNICPEIWALGKLCSPETMIISPLKKKKTESEKKFRLSPDFTWIVKDENVCL